MQSSDRAGGRLRGKSPIRVPSEKSASRHEELQIVITAIGYHNLSKAVSTPYSTTTLEIAPRPPFSLLCSPSTQPDTLDVSSMQLSMCSLDPIYRHSGVPIQQTRPWWCSSSHHHKKWQRLFFNQMEFKIEDFTIYDDQINAAKNVFKRYDKSGQNKISPNDLVPALKALNLSVMPDNLKEWSDLVEEDMTGLIDLKGFLVIYGQKLREDQEERDLQEAVRALNRDNRGELDVDDLRWILKSLEDNLDEEEIEEIIRDIDSDGSGFVNLDEFCKLMTTK